MVSKKNVKMSNNVFIDNIYSCYLTLVHEKKFNELGYETNSFKIWRNGENYFILDKDMGTFITWYRLLGWNVESNTVIKDTDWISFCNRLKTDLTQHGIDILSPTEYIDAFEE